MPTYAYRCPSCGHTYDHFQKMSDKTRAKCPECGTRGERQISGGAGLVFKGSGFYITDYKRAGDKQADKAADTTGEKGAAKPSSSTKPDAGAPADTSPKKSTGADT